MTSPQSRGARGSRSRPGSVLPRPLDAAAVTALAYGGSGGSADLEIGSWGAMGEAPPFQVVAIGPARAGILLEPGFSGQGVSTSGLVLLTEQRDGRFSEVLTVEATAGDNAGACGEDGEGAACWSFESTWDFVEEGARDPRDLTITTKGTPASFSGEGLEEVDQTRLYRFDGAKYVVVK